MRDLFVLMAMIAILPMAVSSTTVAYLMWAWTALISIQDYTYGFMRGIPYNMIFAVIAMAFIMIRRDPFRGRLLPTRTMILFSLFAIQATVSVIFAYDGNPRTWEIYLNLIKALVFCFFMPIVLTTRLRIHGLIIVIVLGLAFHGALEGIKTIASAGAHRIHGMAKFGDNNQLAVVLVMSIPLLVYLMQYSKHVIARTGFFAGFIATTAAVIGTYSRGALLSLMAIGSWVAFTSHRKFLNFILIFLAVVVVVFIAPDSWWARMHTVKEAGADSSFMTRVIAWKVSSAIALENPLTGGGFRAIQTQWVWEYFRESDGLLGFINTQERPIRNVAAHSIYFEVLGDMGFLGLFIFLAILLNVFLTRREINKLVEKLGCAHHWVRDLSDMIGAAIFAFVIGGAALSLAYFEVLYILAMLMEVLKIYLLSQYKNEATVKIIPDRSATAPT